MQKTIRTGVYAILKLGNKILIIKKGRGPFTGLYDLPGGKIEHRENNLQSLERELKEETGLEKEDFQVEKLLTIEEDFVKYTWKGKEKDEHIIAIIYQRKITKENLNLDYIENGGDAKGLLLIDLDDETVKKTNVLKKAIKKMKK